MDSYSKHQCESRSTLIACGWSDEEIDTVLGEPDGHKDQGGPAYGIDRSFLAMLDLADLSDDTPRSERTRLWLGGLDEAEVQTDWPAAVPIHLEGFSWMALCRSTDAGVGNDLMLVRRRRADPAKVKQVHAIWEGFALIKTTVPRSPRR